MMHEHLRDALSCRATTYLVSEARDRDLTPQELASLQAHIDGCPHCQIASRQFENVFSQIEDLFGRSRTGSPAL